MICESLFSQYRTAALQEITKAKEAVLKVLQEEEVNGQAEHLKYLEPINALVEQVAKSHLISEIELFGMRAAPLAIQQAKGVRHFADVRQDATKTPGAIKLEPGDVRQNIALATFHPLGKPISNSVEVEEFTIKVKAALNEAIKKGPVFLE